MNLCRCLEIGRNPNFVYFMELRIQIPTLLTFCKWSWNLTYIQVHIKVMVAWKFWAKFFSSKYIIIPHLGWLYDDMIMVWLMVFGCNILISWLVDLMILEYYDSCWASASCGKVSRWFEMDQYIIFILFWYSLSGKIKCIHL